MSVMSYIIIILSEVRRKKDSSPFVNRASLKATLHDQSLHCDITVYGFPQQLIVYQVVM